MDDDYDDDDELHGLAETPLDYYRNTPIELLN
jgi:hypothetical protein